MDDFRPCPTSPPPPMSFSALWRADGRFRHPLALPWRVLRVSVLSGEPFVFFLPPLPSFAFFFVFRASLGGRWLISRPLHPPHCFFFFFSALWGADGRFPRGRSCIAP